MSRLRQLSIRQKLVVALVAVLTLGAGAAAWAYFTSSGSGTGHAGTATLASPTGVAGTPTGSTVSVTWTGVTAPNGAALTGSQQGYYVTRTPVTPSGPSVNACGSSPSSLLHAANIPCSDASVPSGTYTYTVTAVDGSFSATSAASSLVTVQTDNIPPTVNAPVATAATTFGTSPLFVNNENVNLTAVASDTGGSGMHSVAYFYCAGATGSCTSSTPWTSIGSTTTAAGNWPVTWATPLPADGPYRIVAVATDGAGNSTISALTLVTVDTTPPTVLRPTVNGNS